MPLAPEYQSLLEQLAQVPSPPIYEMTPEDARAAYRLMRPRDDQIAVGAVSELSAPGPAGQIALRIYRPEGEGPFPVLVNFHGGGWVLGDLDSDDPLCRDLCVKSDSIIVSVNYRHAPEDRFPAAAEDGFAAVQWVADNAASLGGVAGQLIGEVRRQSSTDSN